MRLLLSENPKLLASKGIGKIDAYHSVTAQEYLDNAIISSDERSFERIVIAGAGNGGQHAT